MQILDTFKIMRLSGYHLDCDVRRRRGMIKDKLIKAINKIPKHYYELRNPKIKNGKIIDYSNEIVYPERNFCTNLYHHFMVELETEDLNIGEDFFLDEEIYKKFTGTYINDDDFKKTKDALNFPKRGMRPDLVLHATQESRDPEDQLLIIECKIDPNLSEKNFNEDFFKSNIFLSELNFQNSVYIIINNKRNHIESLLKKYKEKYWLSPKGGARSLEFS